MIEISLPLRPRTDVRAEYLVTGISVFSSPYTPILNLTTMNFPSVEIANHTSYEYIELLRKLLKLDLIYTINDRQDDVIKYAKESIEKSSMYIDQCKCLVCECKKYEELSIIRTFNQRRVLDGVCVYCKSQLTLQEISSLFLKIDWPLINFESFNFSWVKKDWLNFQNRQNHDRYKVSKEIEPTRLIVNNLNVGIKHQLLWALQIAFISKTFRDNNIRVHFVEKVKDLAFFICSIAKMLNPQLLIHLKGCPVVWLKEEKKMCNITDCDIEKIKKGLNSKRKEISV